MVNWNIKETLNLRHVNQSLTSDQLRLSITYLQPI
jgi:hypothetical protein